MELKDCELLPGIIINVDDPEKRGRIKASVPTLFDTSVMDEEAIPWIELGISPGYQRFSKMECGAKVQVLRNKKNHLEYYYFPIPNINSDTQESIGDASSSEVLLARNNGQSGSCYIYYNDKEGIILKLGELKIQLNPNKEIHITDGKSSFNIVGGNITIGTNEQLEKAVLGEKLKDLIQQLGGDLVTIGSSMSSMPFVSPLGEQFIKTGSDVQEKCNNILSDTVKISK